MTARGAQAAFAAAAAIAMAVHPATAEPPGVVAFHTASARLGTVAGLHRPEVVAGELILWWADVEPEEGRYDWSLIDKALSDWSSGGKKLDLRLATAHTGPHYTPDWVFDRHGVRRVGRGDFADFEDGIAHGNVHAAGAGRFVAAGEAVLSGSRPLAGARSLVAESPGPALVLGPAADGAGAPLDGATTYSVQFDYRLDGGARGWLTLDSPSGGLGVRRRFAFIDAAASPRSAATTPTASFTLVLPPHPDCRLTWGFDGPGALTLDNVAVVKLADEPTWTKNGFESAAGDRSGIWRILPGATRTDDPALASRGRGAAVMRRADASRAAMLASDPAAYPIRAGEGFSARVWYHAQTTATLVYRIVAPDRTRPAFETARRVAPGEVGKWDMWSPQAIPRDGCRIELGLDGPGEVAVDDFDVVRWTDRATVFPDYFDPELARLWERVVLALGKRYAGDPRLGRVSVGGFGRWEEVILDAEEDGHGTLVPQWISRGYSGPRYLRRVEDCMDLARRAFPGQPLRICLAYGVLPRGPDEDFTYRRVAQAAAQRGIGLKQNGLSERYDTWDTNTNASHLWRRYRDAPGVNLTYETGGQIYRNSGGAAGHPLNLLNRVLIDGTDNLFLYGGDVEARHVAKYLPTAVAQMGGGALFTEFYARLGAFPLRNEHSPEPVDYRHQWLGLRPCEEKVPLECVEVGGEHCAKTTAAGGAVAFDLDDRRMRDGLWGGVFAAEYLDRGRDELALRAWDASRRAWRELARVRKTDSGNWRPLAAPVPAALLASARDSGEDVHRDIEVADLGDGPEWVRGVQLDFVGAGDWARVGDAAPSTAASATEVTSTLTVEIPSPGPGPVVLGVDLRSDPTTDGRVTGRVLARDGDGWRVACEKDLDLLAARESLVLPAVGLGPAGTPCRVEVRRRGGSVAWALDADRRPVVHVETFAETPASSTAAADSAPAVREGNFTLLPFTADAPFFGLRFPADTGPRTAHPFTADVQRALPSGQWATVAAGVSFSANASSVTLLAAFEPQTAGSYRVAIADSGGRAAQRMRAEVRALVRRRPAHAPGPPAVEDYAFPIPPVAAWKPNQGLSALTRLEPPSIEAPATSAPAVPFRIIGPHPALDSPRLGMTAARNQSISFRLRNVSPAGLARVFWADAPGRFSPANSAYIPLVANDAELRSYRFPVGLEPTWTGRIDCLRLELAAGLTLAGRIDISAIGISEPRVLRAWEFNGSPQDAWEAPAGQPQPQIAEGRLSLPLAPAASATLAVPPLGVAFEAEPGQRLVARLRLPPGASGLRFHWSGPGQRSLVGEDGADASAARSVPVPLRSAEAEWQDVRLDLAAHAGWRGTITGLGLSVADAGPGGTLEIDRLLIEQTSVERRVENSQ